MNQADPKTYFIMLSIASIQANAKSLLAQLQEYDFLTVNDEQAHKLSILELDFHALVQEITQS